MEFLSVLNITPDSFSDGGENNNADVLKRKVMTQQEQGIRHFDFGAESTAPNSPALGSAQELERYQEILYPLLEAKVFQEDCTLSIDTYKSETFEQVYQKIRATYPAMEVWWNDVSGVVEQKDWELLGRLDEKTTYVFCHTFIPSKQQTSDHMQFVKNDIKPDELLKEISEKFVTFQFNWNFKGVKSKLILDPCFGFSKNLQQNYQLIKGLHKVFKNVSTEIPVVLGLSRKSFLRDIVKEQMGEELERDVLNTHTEVLHWQLIQKLSSDLRTRKIYIRAHESLYFLLTQRLWERVNFI